MGFLSRRVAFALSYTPAPRERQAECRRISLCILSETCHSRLMPTVATPPRMPAQRPWSLSPVLVTALAYPGAGQLMQRRWVAGGVAIAAFTAAAGWFFVRTGRVLTDYYRLAFDFAGAPESQARPRDIVVPFVVALLVYLACLADATVADIRLRRKASGEPGRPCA